MYARTGGFGSGGTDMLGVGLQVVGCLSRGSNTEKFQCIFNIILDRAISYAEGTDTGEAVLTAIATSATPSAALELIGANETVSDIADVVDALAPFWSSFQTWASEELFALQNAAFAETADVVPIPPEEGGGYLFTGTDGVRRRGCYIPHIGTAMDMTVEMAEGTRCDELVARATAAAGPRILGVAPRTLPPMTSLAGGYVTGTVVDAAGAPIYDAAVRFASMSNRAVKTNADGSFRVPASATTAPLYIVASGYADLVTDPVTVPSGATVPAGALVMALDGSGNGTGKQEWYRNKWTYIAGVPLLAGIVWVSAKLFSGRR